MRRLGVLMAVCICIGLAQEKHAPTAEEKDLTLWKWANFAVLAGGLGFLIAKNAGPFFRSRTEKIQEGMAEAEKLRADAEARVAAVDARLANLQADVEALRSAAAGEQAAAAERMRQETAAEMAKIRAHAEREIASAGKAARMELKRYCAELALHLAEQKIRERMTPENQDALVRSFVQNLAR